MIVLVDWENCWCCNKDALNYISYLTESDTVHIFYSCNTKNLNKSTCIELLKSSCKLELTPLYKSGHNALDFYICTVCGNYMQMYPDTNIGIISCDTGFDSVADFIINYGKAYGYRGSVLRRKNLSGLIKDFREPDKENVLSEITDIESSPQIEVIVAKVLQQRDSNVKGYSLEETVTIEQSVEKEAEEQQSLETEEQSVEKEAEEQRKARSEEVINNFFSNLLPDSTEVLTATFEKNLSKENKQVVKSNIVRQAQDSVGKNISELKKYIELSDVEVENLTLLMIANTNLKSKEFYLKCSSIFGKKRGLLIYRTIKMVLKS